MTRAWRAGRPLLWLTLATVGELAAQDLDRSLERLRSPDPLTRERGEVSIRRLGRDGLVRLAGEVESADRLYRFRAERLFTEALEGLATELDGEQQALQAERAELESFHRRARAAEIEVKLRPLLEKARAADAQFQERLDDLLETARLELQARRAAEGGPPLDEARKMRLAHLQTLRAQHLQANPSLEEIVSLLVEQSQWSGGTAALGELEALRIKDLEERIAEREPRVKELLAQVERLGLPALAGLLVRGQEAADRLAPLQQEVVAAGLRRLEETLVPAMAELEATRYTRGVLWAWEVDHRGAKAAEVAPALERHLQLTLRDLQDSELIVRERAGEELYRLGDRGRAAVESLDPQTAESRFLLGLLRYRIRPATYARTGEDFADYQRLASRDRRRKIFEYAQTTEADAIPTLRALIARDELEPSLNLKLAAAKALAGLRDSWGFNFLVASHPDLLLKRPEVSRELLIIQAYEHIRAKDYQRAVEELQRILDQAPFDFRANYEIGFAYLLLKSFAKSIHHFEIARRIQPGDQLTLYNLACAYALAGGKTEEAIEALEGSVQAGFTDLAHIEKDPDLDSLREHPRYLKLVEDLRAEGDEAPAGKRPRRKASDEGR